MRKLLAVLSALAAFAALAAGCSSSPSSSTPPKGSGPVDVLYAASLLNLMEHDLGPAFSRATGHQFNGFGAGSSELASEIKGLLRQGDVFISASPDVDTTLEGHANGNWLTWDAKFATAPLVLGYNPHSRFAPALRTTPWEQVVTQSGFLLGRTDPVTDPKGKLTVEAIQQAASADSAPSLLQILNSTSGVFPEETLVGRLQAGQLDAGFFYANEAKEAGIPTISLSPVKLAATFTVTVLERAPHDAGAIAFVTYLLGSSGRSVLSRDGLTVERVPAVTGSGVPRGLRSVLHTS